MSEEYIIRSNLYHSFVPLFVGYEQCQKWQSYGPAVRPHWLLHFVLSGKGTYCVGGKEYLVQPGQAFLIRPGEVTLYRADTQEPWFYAWAAFRSEHPSLNHLPYILNDIGLRDTFLSIADSTNPITYGAAVAAIWQIIDRLCPAEILEDRNAYVSIAKSIVHKKYMQDITVGSLAKSLGLDRSYFSGLFKRETGQSPQAYLVHYRMARAKELLELRYPITVVASSVGYKDVFTFSRSFKQHCGYPPSQHKK